MEVKEIDHIIQLFKQTADELNKTDFLSQSEKVRYFAFDQYEKKRELLEQFSRLNNRNFDKDDDKRSRKAIGYDKDISAALKAKLLKAKQEYLESTIKPLQKQLLLYLSPRLAQLKLYGEQKQLDRINDFLPEGILAKNYVRADTPASVLNIQKEEIITALECVKETLKYQVAEKLEAEQKTGGGGAEKPVLNETEKEIITALFKKSPLTGEQIAKDTKHPYDSNLKQHLANLKRRRILGNSKKLPKGYFIESVYQNLAESLVPKS